MFLSIWAVLAFVAIVSGMLIYLYPKQQLLRTINLSHQGEKVTRQYIQNLILIYPKDKNLKLLLAEQDIFFNEPERALQILMPYIGRKPQSRLDWRAQWLFYQLMRSLAFSKKTPPQIKELSRLRMAELIAKLTDGPFDNEQLLQMANDALALKNVALANKVYARIDKNVTVHSAHIYAQLGKLALALGHYQDSATYYFQAQQYSQYIDLKRKYFFLAMESYQQANMLDEALTKAQQYLGILRADPVTIEYLVKLALAANRPKIAAEYHAKIFKMRQVKP
jgi:polysaccharide biosynthesis protein PelB